MDFMREYTGYQQDSISNLKSEKSDSIWMDKKNTDKTTRIEKKLINKIF